MKWRAYWRLMRFDKPAGILLLWYPTAWALWSCHRGMPSLQLIFLISIGTILMRAAGCVFNDITDRNIDGQVARTRHRPLASAELSLQTAWGLFIALLICALLVLLELPSDCFFVALLALFITGIYPFCKRFFSAPQLILGLAFSMGIPMAYLAAQKAFDASFYLLYLINFIWILSYDTIYAMADKADDLRIGVRSTAVLFANYDRAIIACLQAVLQGLWLSWALWVDALGYFYLFWLCASVVLIYQQRLIAEGVASDCFKAFVVSIYYGALMFFAVLFTF